MKEDCVDSYTFVLENGFSLVPATCRVELNAPLGRLSQLYGTDRDVYTEIL